MDVTVTNLNVPANSHTRELDATMVSSERSVEFSRWKYKHYFNIIDVKSHETSLYSTRHYKVKKILELGPTV